MSKQTYIVTSEQVGRGHPDKICDQVSDYILTKALGVHKETRSAVESAIGYGELNIFGELTIPGFSNKDYKWFKKQMIRGVKQLLMKIDKDYKSFKIRWNVIRQSQEINSKVDMDKEIGAGDQGLMYGYATNETETLHSIPFHLATELIKAYDEFVKTDKRFKYDSKAQVSFDYTTKSIVNVNMSVQHTKDITHSELIDVLMEKVISPTINREIELLKLDKKGKFTYPVTINNGGSFISGGAFADSGLSGRKIIADSYGGFGRHGGGSFSSKDYTKVDRSGAYYARYVARKIVESKLADICEIQVAYIIGQSKPVSVNVECFETNKKPISYINKWVNDNFDFSVGNIIKELNLKDVDYTKTTLFGHFGKKELKWG